LIPIKSELLKQSGAHYAKGSDCGWKNIIAAKSSALQENFHAKIRQIMAGESNSDA